jgi:hypothetical protein
MLINERKKSVYTDPGYTADRWFKNDNNPVTLTADGLSVRQGTTLYQYIENSERMHGKEFALSAIVDGKLFWVSGRIPSVLPQTSTTFFFAPIDDVGSQIRVRGSVAAPLHGDMVCGRDFTAEAIKLECGNTSTLLNDEGPDPGYESSRCLRYFERRGGRNKGVLSDAVFLKAGVTVILVTVPYAPKRTASPIVTVYDASNYRVLIIDANGGMNALGISALNVLGIGENSAILQITLNGQAPYDCIGYLQRDDSSTTPYIDINAEM